MVEEKKRRASSSQKLWAVLLVADSFFVIIFGGALAATVYQHYAQAPAAGISAARRRFKAAPAPKPKAAPAPKAKSQPEPAPPKQAAAAPDAAASPPAKAVPVSFHYRASRARNVYLAGAFLVHGGKKAMIRNSKGVWSLTIYLTPNSYRYYFVVDGKKRLDPADSQKSKGESLIAVP